MHLSLYVCLQGGWRRSDLFPIVCEQRGSENPASWLDGTLGDTFFNCCAAKVTIKNLSLLKYTSEPLPVKYKCSCTVGVLCVDSVGQFVCVWQWLLPCVSLKCQCTLLGNVWHVLCFVYCAWNEAVSCFIFFKYLSPSRWKHKPPLFDILSKLGRIHKSFSSSVAVKVPTTNNDILKVIFKGQRIV